MRRSALGAIFACILAVSCALAPAYAAPLTESGGSGPLGAGMLSDRYESLNDLGNSLTNEEGVVIRTRVGVLVSGNRALNDSEVSFDGEAVGDVLNANEGNKWANIMGSSNAVVSTFLTDEQARYIQNVGDYHTTGTLLRITGTYHIACPEHEGELDVHASRVEVVDNGGPVTHLVAPGRIEAGFALCVVAAIILALFLFARHHIRRRAE